MQIRGKKSSILPLLAFLVAILVLQTDANTSIRDNDVTSEDDAPFERKARFIEEPSERGLYISNGALTYEDSNFVLNGSVVRLLSGAIHYFRTVPEYWRDRLLKLKACGLNTVET